MNAPTYAWKLTQERLDMVAEALYKLEVLINTAVSGSVAAENVGKLLTDLRQQCCVERGAEDPCPYMPLFPAFEVPPEPVDLEHAA